MITAPFSRYLPGFNLEQVEKQIEEQHQVAIKIAKDLDEQAPILLTDYIDNGIEYYIQELTAHYYNIVKQGYEFNELRNTHVKYRFNKQSPVYSMRLPNFITNTILWSPLVALDKEAINETVIIDAEAITSKIIKAFIDDKILIPYQEVTENKDLNILIHDMLFILGKISEDFNPILGLSINTETFIDLANRYPRFGEILRYRLREDMQPSEIEQESEQLTKEQIKIIVNDEHHNFLKPIFKSGTGIKEDQYKEFAVVGGLKPSVDGSTVPIPVDSNFIHRGIDSVQSLYVDSLGGSKSLIMNASVMGTSGYFARLINLLHSTITLRRDMEDCDTVHPVLYEVKNKEILKRLKKRYYKVPGERRFDKTIKGDETHLIGKSILVRSPVTCASTEGICKKCYGDLFYTNRDLESVGGLAATKTSEPLSQKILSAKHLLKTTSEKITFSGIFDEFFTVSANEVMLDFNKDAAIENYTLVLIKDNIISFEDIDESGINSMVRIFHIRDIRTNEIMEIQEESGKDLFIAPDFKAMLEATKKRKGRGRKKADAHDIYEIPLVDIGFDDPIFMVEVENNELTKPLYQIMNLLDNKEKRALTGVTNVDEMCQMLIELYIEADLPIDAVHGEILIRGIIRSKEDIHELPDFSKYSAAADTQILTVKTALNNHPSITVSLSFQAISRQFSNILTFKKKKGSYMDPYFKEKL